MATRDRLESDSANMRKLDEELNLIKRQISQKNKENSKINKELDLLAEKRDAAKEQIGEFFRFYDVIMRLWSVLGIWLVLKIRIIFANYITDSQSAKII